MKQHSQEDLDLYLQKTQTLIQTGVFITTIGTAATATSLILMVFVNGEGAGYLGFYAALIGIPIIIIGLPI